MDNTLDQSNMHGSVRSFADQCHDVWKVVRGTSLPESYRFATKVVVTGMGGSALGTHVVEKLFGNELSVPVVRVQDYDLPHYVDEKTLVIFSSYSGTTEETLATYEQAKAKTDLLMAITTGGDLMTWCRRDNIPVITFDPSRYNPSGQPRSAIGYSVVSQIGIFAKLNFIQVLDDQMRRAIEHVGRIAEEIENDPTHPIRQVVAASAHKSLLLFAGPILSGAAHAFSNQVNETGKNFCTYFEIPELNHHLLEGLAHPESFVKNSHVLLIDSPLYHERVSKRFTITSDVLTQLGFAHTRYQIKAAAPIAAALEVLQIGGYCAYLMGLQNNVDPSPVPWVTYFKQQLQD